MSPTARLSGTGGERAGFRVSRCGEVTILLFVLCVYYFC